MKTDNLFGQIVLIGNFSSNFLNKINKNKQIINCHVLSNQGDNFINKGLIEVVSLKKLKKRYRKKSIDFMIINYNNIKPFEKYIVRDSIYLVKNQIIYLNSALSLKEKYQRINIKVEGNKNYYISMNGVRFNFIRDYYYFIKDTIKEWFIYASDVLAR